jgi:hypothetical protein
MEALPLLPAVIAGGAVIMAAALTLAGVILGHLFKRMSDLEVAHAQLWAAREADALIKRAAGDHIDVLEHHIWEGLPPPPPCRPVGV